MERASRFATRALGERFMLSRGLLRCVLGEDLGVPPVTVPLATERLGKPFVPAWPDYRFNLSHTENRTWVATTCGRSVGIDVEEKTRTGLNEAAAAFLSLSEQEEWRKLTVEQRDQYLLETWTRKEAALKAWGVGFSLPPNLLSLPETPISGWSRLAPPPSRADLFPLLLSPVNDHEVEGCVAIACAASQEPPLIEEVTRSWEVVHNACNFRLP